MITYILHGGMTNVPNIHNKKFYREMFKAAKGKSILACYYSRPEKIWKNLLASDKRRMKRSVGNKEFNFIVASKNIKEFLEQLRAAEAIYFRGGDTEKIKKKLVTMRGQLKRLFSGKTILGSSAGAMFLVKYYFDQDHNKILEGFNLLPAKAMTHYLARGEYAATSGKKKLEMLKNYRGKLTTYAIKETEFIVLKK